MRKIIHDVPKDLPCIKNKCLLFPICRQKRIIICDELILTLYKIYITENKELLCHLVLKLFPPLRVIQDVNQQFVYRINPNFIYKHHKFLLMSNISYYKVGSLESVYSYEQCKQSGIKSDEIKTNTTNIILTRYMKVKDY